MKQLVATTLCIVHILALAICTYIAALDIHSILFTGWLCSATGCIAGIASLVSRNRAVAIAAFLTPVVAITLAVLEVFLLKLGPETAALPFSIIFIVMQLITNLISFRSFSVNAESKEITKQISIKAMLLVTVASSMFFAVVRHLLHQEHDTMMLIALTLAGLTFVGVVLTIYNLICSRVRQIAS